MMFFFPSDILLSLSKFKLILYLPCSNKGNGVYKINVTENEEIKVYCRMSLISGCSGGGWTMVMKMDGSKVRTTCDQTL